MVGQVGWMTWPSSPQDLGWTAQAHYLTHPLDETSQRPREEWYSPRGPDSHALESRGHERRQETCRRPSAWALLVTLSPWDWGSARPRHDQQHCRRQSRHAWSPALNPASSLASQRQRRSAQEPAEHRIVSSPPGRQTHVRIPQTREPHPKLH